MDSVRADNMLRTSHTTKLIDAAYCIWVIASIARMIAELLVSAFSCEWLPVDSYLICSDRRGLPELEIDPAVVVDTIDRTSSSDSDDDGGDGNGDSGDPKATSYNVRKRVVTQTTTEGVYYDHVKKELVESKDLEMTSIQDAATYAQHAVRMMLCEPFLWLQVLCLVLHVWTLGSLWQARCTL